MLAAGLQPFAKIMTLARNFDNKEICGLREISSISAHCHASVALQAAKTNI